MEPAVLSAIFNALSDPIRRQILARLAHGPCSVSELGAPFPVSAPAISKHLNVLEHTGLIARWKQGRTYYCKLLNEPHYRSLIIKGLAMLMREGAADYRPELRPFFTRIKKFALEGICN